MDQYFRGDAHAFQTFFDRHSRRVLNYGLAKGLSHQDALDFAQDVFMKLHRSIHLYEKSRPALPWFFTLVHRVLIDCLRKNHATGVNNIDHAFEIQDLPASQEMEDVNDDVKTDLGTLTADQRRVVELRVLEDLSFQEISERTGKSTSAARKIFERAVRSLRKIRQRETNGA